MNTLIGIKKGDLHKIPMQVKKTWKEANNGYLICQEYDKIQLNKWFKISEPLQNLEMYYTSAFTEKGGRKDGIDLNTFCCKRMQNDSTLPNTLLGLGISYILINNVDEVLEQKVKIERFGSKTFLAESKKTKKPKKIEIKKETFFKKTKSKKIKVKSFLGFFEGIKT